MAYIKRIQICRDCSQPTGSMKYRCSECWAINKRQIKAKNNRKYYQKIRPVCKNPTCGSNLTTRKQYCNDDCKTEAKLYRDHGNLVQGDGQTRCKSCTIIFDAYEGADHQGGVLVLDARNAGGGVCKLCVNEKVIA